MPFKSLKQAAKFEQLAKQGKISKKTLHEFREATDYSKLPERAAKQYRNPNQKRAGSIKKAKKI